MLSQHVWDPLGTPQDVVAALGAMQAQEFRIALWSVGQRCRNADEASVLRAFNDGKILRTHVLRPTWHFVAATDFRWLLAFSGPRVDAQNTYRYRQLELDEKLLVRTTALIEKSLTGGNHLTRRQLGELLQQARISTNGQRLAYIVMRAELEGVICSGALSGKQHTYALVEERAPKAKRLERDEALAELARRYFTSHGPATIKDFSRWSSLTMADCRAGLGSIADELHHEAVGDRTYWFAEPSRPTARSAKVVDLVQIYDELVMGYSESRDALFETAPPEDLTPLMHAVLLDGRLVGHWKPTYSKDAITVETSLYRSLSKQEGKALDVAVQRYGTFVGLAATLRLV
jgi:hypothetical protein